MHDNTTTAALVAEFLGGAMLLLLVLVLIQAHFSKDSRINLADLLLDHQLNKRGQVTLAKFGGFIALLASTWIVVYLALDKALTDFIFVSYLGAWVLGKLGTELINSTAKKEGT
jgi:hypothetical protein